MPQDSWITY